MPRNWLNGYGVPAAILTVVLAAAAACLIWWVPIVTRWHIRSLASDSEVTRQEARTALASLGPPAQPTLVKFREHRNPRIRLGVAQVLSDLDTAESLAALLPMTDDRDAEVRRQAIWTLMADAHTFRRCRLDLRREVDHPDPVVRLCAVALMPRGDLQGTVEPLLAALEDGNSLVRQASVKRLRALSHTSFGFDAFVGARARAPAVARWRAWWAGERKRLPSDRAYFRARSSLLGAADTIGGSGRAVA